MVMVEHDESSEGSLQEFHENESCFTLYARNARTGTVNCQDLIHRKSLLNCYSHGGSRIEVDDVIVGAMNIEESFDEEPMSKQTIGQGGNLWKLKMGSSEHLPLRESPQRSISNPLPHFSILFHAPKYSTYMPLRFPVYGVPLEKFYLQRTIHLSQACFLNIRCGSSEFVFSCCAWKQGLRVPAIPGQSYHLSRQSEDLQWIDKILVRIQAGIGQRSYCTGNPGVRYVGADYLKPIKPSSADERRSPLPGKWNALRKPTE
ncbi:hypothetical protein EV368DRAFT_65535 [Lentinula lateritia]|nr:hypothetical protein EV368DRAFT_65535 [Lentinula lateritia]